MSAINLPVPPARPRYGWIDGLRGIALIAMATYHFMWDLSSFGYLDPDFAATGWPRLYARSIASTFLFLAGMGLVMAHAGSIRWNRFARRLGLIVAAAALVTLGTYLASPSSFIYFGILHAIALFSVLGLAALYLPFWLTLAIGIAFVAGLWLPRQEFFNQPWLWWTGLSPEVRHSDDFVPLMPWFGPFLIGMAVMQALHRWHLLERTSVWDWTTTRLQKGLVFLGHHSLAFYLVHQPVLIGALAAFAWFVPPTPPDPVALYQRQCMASCVQSQASSFCQRFCACTIDRLMEENLFDALVSRKINAKDDTRLSGIGAECTNKAF